MEHPGSNRPNSSSPVPQNSTNHSGANSIQHPFSTWSNSSGNFESTLWKRRHYSKVVDGCLQAVSDYPQPCGPGDDQGHLGYVQHVFKQMSQLIHLMGPDGKPIRELREILGSNSFLLALYNVLPFKVRSKYVRHLAANNISLTLIRGEKHFNLMMNELRIYLRTLEMLTPSDLLDQPSGSTSVPSARPSSSGVGMEAQATPTPSALTRAQSNSAGMVAVTTSGGLHAPRSSLPRWTCPLRNHEYHAVQTCSDFFSISIRERLLRMRHVACFTCLGRGALCTARSCGRFHDVPEELLCEDCFSTNEGDKPVPIVLLCGLACHRKPQGDTLATALESWIPRLNLGTENIRLRLSINPGTAPRSAPPQTGSTQ
jgi:hypothetical protein